MEAVGEPRAFEPRPGDAVGGRHFDALMIGARPGAANRALAADDERAVQVIELREAVEDQRHLRRFIFDDRLGQERGQDRLRRGAGHRGVDSPRLARRP